eukprot:gene25251-30823_t
MREAAGQVAAKCLQLKRRLQLGFVGGIESLKLNLVEGCYFLHTKQWERIKDAFLRGFRSDQGGGGFPALVKLARATGDVELSARCNLVQRLTERCGRVDVPDLLASIAASDVGADLQQLRRADLLLSTAHKAKGLEFDTVVLQEDFQE